MKIALINENSQAAKNEMICATLKSVVEPMGHEVIVKGCGIAFQKKKGQQVEESRIEKIFTAENAQISKEIQGYLTAIPEKYLDFVGAFVNEVKEKEGMK